MAMAAAEEAKKKNLCLVSGLCWRYDLGVREVIKRVLDGAIGEIIAIEMTYLRGPYVLRERQPGLERNAIPVPELVPFQLALGRRHARNR